MKLRFVPLGTLAVVMLSACSQTAPNEVITETGTLTIGEITAGTMRDSAGEITDKTTTFSPNDSLQYFNVVMENVTEPTIVTAYWILENDDGNFANVPLTVTTTEPVAKFELEKDTPWPVSTYTMYVEAGTGGNLISKTFQYQVKE